MIGITVMPVVIGPVFGPTLAGFILQHWGWPWIFFINLPVGILATLLAWRVLPADQHETRPRPFDIVGFMLLSPGLVMFLHSVESIGVGMSGSFSRYELAAALLLLAGFSWHAVRRGKAALIDIRLFRDRTFSAAAITQFISNCTVFGGMMMFPLYLLTVEGRSPGNVGVLLASTGIGLLCALPLAGKLTDRFGPRRVSTGGAVCALLGTLPFALLHSAGLSAPVVCAALFARGAGLGCITIPSISAAYASIPKEHMPVATTAINIVQRLGGPVATTFLALFLQYSTSVHSLDRQAAFGGTFLVFCVIHALAIPSALCLPLRRPSRARSM